MHMLKRALESNEMMGDNDKEKTIVMRGPLSEIIYRALNVYYDKDRDEDDMITLESQAQEVVVFRKKIDADGQVQISSEPTYTVYGVNKLAVEPEDIVEVKRFIDASKLEDPSRFILFVNVDPRLTGDFEDTNSKTDYISLCRLDRALEDYVQARGGQVVYSLETLKDSLVQ